MADSILTSTKAALGLAADYNAFDAELIMFINAVLADLNQLGIGPDSGLSITGADETWDLLLTEVDATAPDARLNNVKSLVFLKVGMLFDPPSVGYVVTAREKMIDEATWRVTVAQDEIVNPPVPEVVDDDWWDTDNVIVIDGGTP